MTSRSIRRDDRGVAVYLVILIFLLMFTSLAYATAWGPVSELKDHAESNAEGSEYEEEVNKGSDWMWDAFTAVPVVATLLAILSAFAYAVILSSVR